MLGDQQHRTAPFAAERETLHQSHQHQQQRGGNPDGGVGRQQRDKECRYAHQQ